MTYTIYTDGGYSQKHQIGAFAYVMLDENGNIVKKNAWKIENETNNRAELKAIITGIYHLPQSGCKVLVISDSQYALNTLSGKWGRNTNKDLFEVFGSVLEKKKPDVEYRWERGHSGNKWNEMCDQMCNEAAGFDLNEEYQKYKKK